mmetsp:Transcript_16374/g.38933  ORF Transcript_16374/g.38933 Transcript_16374/m.38933 type:complete len:604 (-) Transcript_16374:65-1876(-)
MADARRVAGRVGARWRHASSVASWNEWAEHATEWRAAQRVGRKAIGRLRQRAVALAWAHWIEASGNAADTRGVLEAAGRAVLAGTVGRAMRAWVETWETAGRAQHTLDRGCTRLARRGVTAALLRWWVAAVDQRTMRRVAARLLRRGTWSAFSSLTAHAEAMADARRVARRAGARWQLGAVAASWNEWTRLATDWQAAQRVGRDASRQSDHTSVALGSSLLAVPLSDTEEILRWLAQQGVLPLALGLPLAPTRKLLGALWARFNTNAATDFGPASSSSSLRLSDGSIAWPACSWLEAVGEATWAGVGDSSAALCAADIRLASAFRQLTGLHALTDGEVCFAARRVAARVANAAARGVMHAQAGVSPEWLDAAPAFAPVRRARDVGPRSANRVIGAGQLAAAAKAAAEARRREVAAAQARAVEMQRWSRQSFHSPTGEYVRHVSPAVEMQQRPSRARNTHALRSLLGSAAEPPSQLKHKLARDLLAPGRYHSRPSPHSRPPPAQLENGRSTVGTKVLITSTAPVQRARVASAYDNLRGARDRREHGVVAHSHSLARGTHAHAAEAGCAVLGAELTTRSPGRLHPPPQPSTVCGSVWDWSWVDYS